MTYGDYTAKQLLDLKLTLNQVDDLVHDGRVTEETANAYFREWCKGKMEHRWNAAGQCPEECITDPHTYRETWRRMRWG